MNALSTIVTGSVLGLSLLALPPLDDPIHGQWTGGIARASQICLQLRAETERGESSFGATLRGDQLVGLSADDERLTAERVRFDLRREAGAFEFEGSFRNGRGAGLFSFAPRAEYGPEMKALGYTESFSIDRLFRLAAHDIGPAFIRELQPLGYREVAIDDLLRMKTHGVDAAFIKALQALGYKGVPADQLARTRDHGVTPELITGLKAAGYEGLSLEALIRTRDHGVTPEFVREMARAGLEHVPLEDLVRARDHGVTPEYARAMAPLGGDARTLEGLVRLRDHGVDSDYIAEMGRAGYQNLDSEELVSRN